MNRQQAEHILDAYVRMRMRESDKDASDALREVILDAMANGVQYVNSPTITWPNAKPIATYTGTADPNVVRPSITTSASTAKVVE